MRRLVDLIGLRRTETKKPSIPKGMAVFAIGDIHGCADLLVAMHQEILHQSRQLPKDTKKVILYLGDYIDHGPQSADVIDVLVATNLPGFTAIHLMGNHELAFLDFLKGKQKSDTIKEWLYEKGGLRTIESYGVTVSTNLTAMRHELLRKIPTDHLDFLEKLHLSYQCGDFFFVHAGVDPNRPITNQSPADLLGIGEKFLSNPLILDKVIVHGHTPYPMACIKPNRIGLDTNAYQSGVLSGIMLYGHEFHILQTT